MQCGIDFGTSNSSVAVVRSGHPRLAELEQGRETLPSAVFYPAHGGMLAGRAAIDGFFGGGDGRFMRSLKRVLGSDLMAQGTVVNGARCGFQDIIGDFVSHLKRQAEVTADSPLDSVVLGRPVHFVDDDAAADAMAQAQLEGVARACGFRHVEFQYEPIAAAFAHEASVGQEMLALVVDIGGGTSDFSVIRLAPSASAKADRRQDILANAGVRIGGNDFDKSFSLGAFMPAFGYGSCYGEKKLPVPSSFFFELSEWSKINFLYTPANRRFLAGLLGQSHDAGLLRRLVKTVEDETGHKVLAHVEKAKIDLTRAPSASVSLEFVEQGFAIDASVEDLNRAVAGHVRRIDAETDECLKRAGVKNADIQLVILTGGTTEVPLLEAAVKNRFRHARFSEDGKLSSVGLGLGHESLRRFGSVLT